MKILFLRLIIIYQKGSPIFWITYLTGSVFGGIASLIEYKYHHQQTRLEQTKTETQSIWNKMTEPINNTLQYYGNKVIDSTFEFVNDSRGMVGCSSSVYALYAFDFVLTIDRSKRRFYKLFRKYVLRDDTIIISQNEKLYTLFDLISLYSGLKRIQHDLEYLWFDKFHRSKIDHIIVASPDNIAHSSHVGGFLAGMFVFAIWKLYSKYKYNNGYSRSYHHNSHSFD